MIQFKYIITQDGALLFNDAITHKSVAPRDRKVYSAGFCNIDFYPNDEHKVICYGKSESLSIASIPIKDEYVIRDILRAYSKIKYYNFSIKNFYEEEDRISGTKPQ